MKRQQATRKLDGSGWSLRKIPVMEIFGPTIQGEGAVVGQKTMFVRTAGCDYSCAWCDSAFTWDGSGKELTKMMTAEEIWEELIRLGGDGFSFVTISGGNPALLKNLEALVGLLKEKDMTIAVETQGSKWQDWFYDIDELTISPKPPSSGMITNFDVLDDILSKLATVERHQRVSLKVVVFNDEDLQYAKRVHQRYVYLPFFIQVGNDDVTTIDQNQLVLRLLQKYEEVINKVMLDAEWKNVRVLPQLHTYIWGNKRGV